jgi:hypothetical protein
VNEDTAPRSAPGDAPAEAGATTAPAAGDVVVALSAGAFATAERIARLKGVGVEQAMSDALALQEAVSVEKSTGARLLIERHGEVEELAG